jgi:hypothetical protein
MCLNIVLLENNSPSVKFIVGSIQLIMKRSDFPACHSTCQSCAVDSWINIEISVYKEIRCLSSCNYEVGYRNVQE